MFIKNCWYVAAWDVEVPEDKMLARTLLAEPILFYRTTAGRVVALEDRCCHRAAPLHLGRKEGDDVRCMYHGLKFAPNGACVEIPGQATIPTKTCVRSYPVVERNRLVWIWMGEPSKADPSARPTRQCGQGTWRGVPFQGLLRRSPPGRRQQRAKLPRRPFLRSPAARACGECRRGRGSWPGSRSRGR